MTDKIDFFDDRKVGAEARRLAHCFNLSARMPPSGGNPLAYTQALFKESTGLETVPAFNEEEISYLRLKLMETASITMPKASLTVQELRDEGELLFKVAEAMQLIRQTGAPISQPPKPDPDERHPSFPGS